MSPDPNSAPIHVPCRVCGAPIDGPDRFCRYCGGRQDGTVAWYYQPVIIAILALVILGPFAIPLVWKSPKFTQTQKWLVSFAIMIYTIYLCYKAWQTTQTFLGLVNEMGDLNGNNL